MKRPSMIALCLGLGLLAGCAATRPLPATVPPQLFADDAFEAPAHLVAPAEVFALSPAMKRYLEVEIASQIRSRGRLRGLIEALHSKAQLHLEFDTDTTRTAAEAFDARAGNCLSLVVMTAALAKHLELPLQYQVLIGQETWSRNDNLSIINGHVNITVDKRLVDRVAGYDPDTALRLEFGTLPAGRGSGLRVVSEATIVAMFMNNRAAEWLARGELADAYAYARAAVVQAPDHASGYNTLGVVYQRRGLADRAESAYRHALERDMDDRAALMNLARLLDGQGRAAEAAPLRERLARLEAEPPFMHFDLGRAAAQAGDFRTARDEILRELRRDPDYHEFHFWLAVALYGLGDVERAREHLTTAMQNSTTRREQALYASKLQHLPTAAAMRSN